ncbi:unnamed protein product [Kuraishia capsulata CBS 1993]|uniref:Mitochondrial import inner membrane translocase subunit n=1 Tax=Kuraishia capsulata CBS 1993 TaxID=1382522 RepID=W6MNX6_9ASCO|nr:uncharacterized protein KUCA_T00004356001 [Kuraishia capsulata CBS 1993]CDK28374.1 unnamed protein product [Kuraishia capsulata CBS 1993]
MSGSQIDPSLFTNLDAQSQQEVARFLEAETSKSKVQMSIHQYTDMCFKKCVKKIDSSDLNSGEQQCLQTCLDRFLDTNISIVKL